MILVTTCLYKLEKDKLSVIATVQVGQVNITQTRTNNLKRTPTIVMLMYLPTLNSGRLINPKTRLHPMTNNVSGAPSTRWVVNLKICTFTTHPIITINGHIKSS